MQASFKKTVSVIASLALLMTALFSVMALPQTASALDDESVINLIASEVAPGGSNEGNGTYEVSEDGTLTVTSTDTNVLNLTWTIPTSYDVTKLDGVHFEIESTAAYKIAFCYQTQSDDGATGPQKWWTNTASTTVFPVENDRVVAGTYDETIAVGTFVASTITDPTNATATVIVLVENGTLSMKLTAVEMPVDPAEERGEPATPSNPLYDHAANAPKVAEKVDILARMGKTDDYAHTGWASISLKDGDTNMFVDLTVTPYLYYSFEQPDTAKSTFILYGSNPWSLVLNGTTNTLDTSWSSIDAQGVVGSQTGCIDLRDYVSEEYLANHSFYQINWQGGSADTTVNYLFFGSEPLEPTLMPEDEAAISISGGSFTYEDGQLVVTATGECTVSWEPNYTYNINDNPNCFMNVSSTAASGFDIVWAGYGNFDMTSSISGDWAYAWAKAPLEYGAQKVTFIGSPRWNSNIPDDGSYTIKKVTITVKSAGTFVLDSMEMAEVQTTTTSPTTQTQFSWDSSVDLMPTTEGSYFDIPAGGSSIVVTVKDNSIVLSNTNGSWPAYGANYETPFLFAQADSAIHYDLDIAGDASFILFFGEDTADSYVGNYLSINSAITGSDGDIGAGHYEGYVYFKDLQLPDGAYDEQGNVKLNSIKVFAVGSADKDLVTVNDLSLLYNEDNIVTTTTTTEAEVEETTTTTAPQQTVLNALLPEEVDAWTDVTDGVVVTAAEEGFQFESPSTGDWANAYFAANAVVNKTDSIYYNVESEGKFDVIFYSGNSYATLGDILGAKYNLDGALSGSVTVADVLTKLSAKNPDTIVQDDDTLTITRVRIYTYSETVLTVKELYAAAEEVEETTTTTEEEVEDTTTTTEAEVEDTTTTTEAEVEETTTTTEAEVEETTTTTTEAPVVNTTTISLLQEAENAYSIDASGSSAIVTVYDDGSVAVSNTNGAWPAAAIDYTDAIVFAKEDAVLNYNFDVVGSTNIILFFGEDTATSYNGSYLSLNPAIGGVASGDDLNAGHYEGTLNFSELDLPDGSYDEQGNVKITAIKLFAVGAAGADLVTFNELSVTFNPDAVVTTTTTEAEVEETTTTTEAEAAETTTTTEAEVEETTTTTEAEVVPTITGDLDGNDTVNMADAMLLYQAASGAKSLSSAQAAVADLDGNGVVNIRDAMLLYLRTAGEA